MRIHPSPDDWYYIVAFFLALDFILGNIYFN